MKDIEIFRSFKKTILEGNTALRCGDACACIESSSRYYGHDAIVLDDENMRQLMDGLVLFGNNGEYSFSIVYRPEAEHESDI